MKKHSLTIVISLVSGLSLVPLQGFSAPLPNSPADQSCFQSTALAARALGMNHVLRLEPAGALGLTLPTILKMNDSNGHLSGRRFKLRTPSNWTLQGEDVSQAVERGPRKTHLTPMLDRTVVDYIDLGGAFPHSQGRLLAVLDGRGRAGDDKPAATVEFLAKNLTDSLKKALSLSQGDVRRALQVMFDDLKTRSNELNDRLAIRNGSTLALVYLPRDEWKAYVLWVGDSGVTIRGRDGQLYTTPISEEEAWLVFGEDDWETPGKSEIQAKVAAIPLDENSLIALTTDGFVPQGLSLEDISHDLIARVADRSQNALSILKALEGQPRDDKGIVFWRYNVSAHWMMEARDVISKAWQRLIHSRGRGLRTPAFRIPFSTAA